MQKSHLKALFIVVLIILVFTNIAIFAQEVTSGGALTYSYPLNLPAGRNGVAPNLSLVYNSNAGNGMLGVGWSLGGLSIITRDSSYPITFDDTTDHFLLDGQKLVKGQAPDANYHTEKESYVRIEFTNSGSANYYWVVTLKNGTKMYYGWDDADHDSTNDGYVNAIDKNGKALVWCLSRVEDVNGNYYTVEYNEDDVNGDYYPVKIEWTKPAIGPNNYTNKVEFSYESMPVKDTSAIYVPSLLKMDYRLTYITVSTGGNTQRIYKITYKNNTGDIRSCIRDIQELGNNAAPTPPPGLSATISPVPTGSALPLTSFEWSSSASPLQAKTSWPVTLGTNTDWDTGVADFNGDGKDDIWQKERAGTTFKVWTSTGSVFSTTAVMLTNLLTDSTYIRGIADFNGDGKADIWQAYRSGNSSPYIWLAKFDANGLSFDRYQWSPALGNPSWYGTGTADFNGDGKADFYQLFNDTASYMWIYLTNSTATGFETPQHWGSSFGYRNWYTEGIGDFNGDGKADFYQLLKDGTDKVWVWLTNSSGSDFEPVKGFGTSSGHGFWYAGWSTTGTADFNGDGKTDVWQKYRDNSTLCVWISNGNDLIESHYWISGGGGDSQYPFRIADFNGDGRMDAYQKDYNDSYTKRLWIYFSNGHGYESAPDLPANFTGSNLCDTITGDFNGDCKADVWQKKFDGTESNVWLADANPLDLVTKITLPTGGTVDITYKPASQVPGAIIPNPTPSNPPGVIADSNPRNLVTKIELNAWTIPLPNPNPNNIVTEYEYSNHLKTTGFSYERTDLGFEWIKKIDKSGDSATNPTYGAYTKTWYNQDKPFEGLVKKVETFDANGNMHTQAVYKYGSKDIGGANSGIKFIYKVSEETFSHNGEDGVDGQSGTPVHYRVRYCADPDVNPIADYYDEKGNLTRVENDGDMDNPGDESKVETAWISNNSTYANGTIFAPKLITKTAKNLAGVETAASETRLSYDNLGYGVAITKGLLTKKEIENGNDDITLKYGYDLFGNLEWFRDGKMSGGADNTVSYTYDPNYKTYLLTETNAKGYSSSIHYNSLMWPTQVTDANGQVWKTEYDEFGRVEKTATPGDNIDTSPTKQFVYNNFTLGGEVRIDDYVIFIPPSLANTQSSIKQNANYINSYSYYDGLGRVIQTKTPQTEVADKWITVDYYYDSSGRNYKTSVPYLPSSTSYEYTPQDTSQKAVVNTYDKIGRVIKTTNTDGTFSRTAYGKQRVLSIDENGYVSSKEASGNTVKECSFTNIYNGCTPDSNTADYWAQTRAAWDGVEITDSTTSTTGYMIKTVCDMLGRKQSYTDPNMGTWTYDYDANGNLLSQTDAKLDTTSFVYDELNRVQTKSNADGTTTYTYGENAALFNKGRLVSVAYPGGSESYTYDERGRVATITMVVDTLSKTFTYGYNSADQLVTETYPTGEVLTYTYDSAGQLEKVTGQKTGEGGWGPIDYAKDIGYTALNKIKEITYGNEVKTTYDYYDEDWELDKSNNYRTHSNRLFRIAVQKQDLTLIGDLRFEYDATDKIKLKSFLDAYQNSYEETFQYDHTGRLSLAQSDLYLEQNYTYDPNNNMRRKGDKYLYYNAMIDRDGNGTRESLLPHAVSEIKDSSNNTLYTYDYDKNGNMTRAAGHSTITVHAKKTEGTENPRMELWMEGVRYMSWVVTNTEYRDYTWNGLWKSCPIEIRFVNGDTIGTDLYVDKITLNNTVLESEAQSTEYIVEYQTNPGQELMVETSKLVFHPQTGQGGIQPLDRTIAYNHDNKVNSINENGNTSTFTYDYMGSRIKKVESFNGVATGTYYFGAKYEEQVSAGVTKKISYYFQNGQRVAQRTQIAGQGDELLYWHSDHLGSAVRLTDVNGDPVQSMAYSPFGETVFYAGTKDPNYQFTGQELDSPSGLYYYGARYYCPEIGRFIQADTVLAGLNRYSYCRNNPMSYTDPTGHREIIDGQPGSRTEFSVRKDSNTPSGYDVVLSPSSSTNDSCRSTNKELPLLEGDTWNYELPEISSPQRTGKSNIGLVPPSTPSLPGSNSENGSSDITIDSILQGAHGLSQNAIRDGINMRDNANGNIGLYLWGSTMIVVNSIFEIGAPTNSEDVYMRACGGFIFGKVNKTITALKAINLPAWKTIAINIAHILSGHTADGIRGVASKTLFPAIMNEGQIVNAIRQAYRYGSKIETQGNRIRMQGQAAGLTIEMWVNTIDKIIETAYPLF